MQLDTFTAMDKHPRLDSSRQDLHACNEMLYTHTTLLCGTDPWAFPSRFTGKLCYARELHMPFEWALGSCLVLSWKHKKASGKHHPLVIIKAPLACFHMEYP